MWEVWSLCHQSDVGGHRGLEGTLNKFLKGFFMQSARHKIHFLNGGCDTCLTKEQIISVRAVEHVPLLTGNVGEKLYVDLVSMLETIRENRYMLMARIVLADIIGHIPSLTRKHTWWPRN